MQDTHRQTLLRHESLYANTALPVASLQANRELFPASDFRRTCVSSDVFRRLALLRRRCSGNVYKRERSSTVASTELDRELNDESMAAEEFHALANVRSFLAAECGIQWCDGECVDNSVGLSGVGRD